MKDKFRGTFKSDFKFQGASVCLVITKEDERFEVRPNVFEWINVTRYDICCKKFIPIEWYEMILENITQEYLEQLERK